MHIQAEDWLSAEKTAQPFAWQSMGPHEGALGITEHRRPSERDTIISASARRQNSFILPNISKRQRLRSI
eukprot:3751892-Pyramimonas_sp.AAC.1